MITSKTRIRLLLKFFTNTNASAYLRGLAEEFGESTNAIRHELNNLSKAGYLVSAESGRTILYRANVAHPLFQEVKNLVHKFLGIDKIIENVLKNLGDLELAYIVGDYAQGRDSGTIELILIGDVNKQYLERLTAKAGKLLSRSIKATVVAKLDTSLAESGLLIWKKDETTVLNYISS